MNKHCVHEYNAYWMLKLIFIHKIFSFKHLYVWTLFHANPSTYESNTLNHHPHDVTTLPNVMIHLLLLRWHGHEMPPLLVCIL
jgi:hypothetical protein